VAWQLKNSSGQTAKTRKKHRTQNSGWTSEIQPERAKPRFVSATDV